MPCIAEAARAGEQSFEYLTVDGREQALGELKVTLQQVIQLAHAAARAP